MAKASSPHRFPATSDGGPRLLRQRCTPIESRGLPKTAQSRWRHPPPPPDTRRRGAHSQTPRPRPRRAMAVQLRPMRGPATISSRCWGSEWPRPDTLPACVRCWPDRSGRRGWTVSCRVCGARFPRWASWRMGPHQHPETPPQASTVHARAMVAARSIFFITSGRATTSSRRPRPPHSPPLATPSPPHSRGGARPRVPGRPPPRTARRCVPPSRSRRPAPLPRRPATLPARHPALPPRLPPPSCPPRAHASGLVVRGVHPATGWGGGHKSPPRAAAVVPLPSRAARVVVGSAAGPLPGLTAVAVVGGRGRVSVQPRAAVRAGGFVLCFCVRPRHWRPSLGVLGCAP